MMKVGQMTNKNEAGGDMEFTGRLLDLCLIAVNSPGWESEHNFKQAMRDELARGFHFDHPIGVQVWFGVDKETGLPAWRTADELPNAAYSGQSEDFQGSMGLPNSATFRTVMDKMLHHFSFHEEFWVDKATEYVNGKGRTSGGSRIWVDDDYTWHGMKSLVKLEGRRTGLGLGYGGSMFHVKFHDGSYLSSNNVWCGGTVPKIYRKIIKPNGFQIAFDELPEDKRPPK